MKKFLLVFVLFLSLVTLAACAEEGDGTYEIALITDVGTINDKSFNQGSWEGVLKFIENEGAGKTYQYYQPASKATSDYVQTIELAIENGAKVIVTPGFLFENAIWMVQNQHPTVKFILLDGSPHNVSDWVTMETVNDGDVNFDIADNVLSVFYAEEESGFLAGYAAVQDGYRKLGFMGGMAVPAVVRFGYGFIAGANYAATELELADGAIEMRYMYLGNFDVSADNQAAAAGWYNSGTELIFAAAGGAGNSVMRAAEVAEKKVIGVDINQKDESPTVITSAMKELANSVYDSLVQVYDGTFEGGRQVNFTAANDGVALPDDFSRFTTFTKAMYDVVFAKLAGGEIDFDGSDSLELSEVATANPKVNVLS